VNPVRNALSIVLLMLFSSSALFPNLRQVEDDQWKNLMQANRGRSYAFVTDELDCADGRIAAVTKQTVTLKRSNGTTVSIETQHLLRFGDEGIRSIGIIYSGRSSWFDVKDLPHNSKGGAELQVVMLDGTKHHGQLLDVQDTTMTLLDADHRIQFAKIDISQIYRFRFKTLSSRAQYAYDELFVFKIFDPELWPYFLNKGRVSVLLYDSRMKEDDSAIQCKQEL
jgi:hypothetical protein